MWNVGDNRGGRLRTGVAAHLEDAIVVAAAASFAVKKIRGEAERKRVILVESSGVRTCRFPFCFEPSTENCIQLFNGTVV
jgi:hypothetical protein